MSLVCSFEQMVVWERLTQRELKASLENDPNRSSLGVPSFCMMNRRLILWARDHNLFTE